MRDIRTYVRCGAQVVELTTGRSLTVGRADDCDLVLDDALSSRHHFRLEVAGDLVEAVDLGSRNGILVNGLPVDGRQELHHGDLITAGRSQISIAQQAHRPRTDSVVDVDADELARERTSSAGDLTATGNVFDILAGSATLSLDERDIPSADRSARNLFVAIRSSYARRRPIRESILSEAAEIALRLTDETRDVGWLDRVLELHVAAERPMPGPLTERVIEAARALGDTPRTLGDYVAFARAAGDPSAERLAAL